MGLTTLDASYGSRKYRGEIEFITRDRRGNIIDIRREHNIVKIFAKEILAHRVGPDKIWDYLANAWVNNDAIVGTDDPTSDFSAKYILFGASYDSDGVALDTNDARFYSTDEVTSRPVPVSLSPGAHYSGSLINAIPISEPNRPLKRIETVSFEPSYQPAGSPLLQDDVRAINNIVLLETTLRADEYNGFGVGSSDIFTITEVALAAGKEFGSVGACELTPRQLFLHGNDLNNTANDDAVTVTANGTDVITISGSESNVDFVRAGDQIMLVNSSATASSYDTLNQTSPFYLVVSKLAGGRDIQLDRVPTNSSNVALSGTYGVLRDSLRIFSHRILNVPLRKTSDVEITVRWRLIFN